MSRMSRTKGAAAEREVFKIFNDELGLEIRRNLDQYQQSDSDARMYGFCIEIKRCEKLNLRAWWKQVVDASKKDDSVPILIYRQSRQPWRVMMPMAATSPIFDPTAKWLCDFEWTQTVLLEPAFMYVLRETISSQHIEMMTTSSTQH